MLILLVRPTTDQVSLDVAPELEEFNWQYYWYLWPPEMPTSRCPGPSDAAGNTSVAAAKKKLQLSPRILK